MRSGFTTGSCAAAAAKAAAYMLLTGKVKEEITIMTPAGIPFHAQLVDIRRQERSVSCAVIKDGGDDPDVTTGCHITATVSAETGSETARYDVCPAGCDDTVTVSAETASETARYDVCQAGRDDNTITGGPDPIVIDGGPGVGRVTKPGLDQPVGAAAINHVPRKMIRDEVEDVLKATGMAEGLGSIWQLHVTISVPEGERVAKKTFNPRLGIEGGISILGTSGIVEPMSEQAIRDTIFVELRQKKAEGYPVAPVSPGNYGLEFMKRAYGYDLDRSVKCSNFIGDTIDMAADLDFPALLLTGHIGKLVKISGGILNTHSRYADCRMELLSAAAILAGADSATARKVLGCVATEEAIRILDAAAVREDTMQILMERIMRVLTRKADGRLCIACILYSNDQGLLAKSSQAEEMLQQLLGVA